MFEPGLPERFDGPSAWVGADMRDRTGLWLRRLSPAEIAQLQAAARHYLSLGRDIAEITRADFPLGGFADYLAALKGRLLRGAGFELLRGLPVDGMDRELSATIFCGIGAHLGRARSQNAAGHILGHVRNTGADPTDPNTRIYQTAARQSFHTDSADVVGLLCLRAAREGGDSLLVSVEAIYNRMRARAPELLARLFRPMATDRRGEVPPGMDPWMTIPPLSWYDGHLTVFYQRQYIDSAQRFAGAPGFDADLRLTQADRAALDLFDALANDPGLHLRMRLEPGDMQFVHNHGQLHDRTGFTDWPEPARRRHLLRLWLSVAGDRALPESFRQRYGSIEIGNRGGIVTAGTRLHAPLD